MSDKPDFLKALPWIERHLELYRTDPEKAHMWDASLGGGTGLVPTLLLTTTGRKSGKPRTMPLIYREVDGVYVIVASKGGAPNHPLWYENLVVEPNCHVQVASKKFDARARMAGGAERVELWGLMCEIYPPYDDYQERAPREIPVMVLEPTV